VGDNLRLYYEIEGQGDTLILIHGGFVDRRMWDDQVKDLSQSFTIIRYDMRGFGQSDAPTKPYHPVGDLLALYEALGVGRASLVGHAMGGSVALSFSLAYPDRVNALVLVSSPANGLPATEEEIDRVATLFHTDATLGTDSAVALWLRDPMLAGVMEKPDLARRMEYYARDNARAFAVKFWPFVPEDPPPSERLGEIRAPTLVIWGENDTESIQRNSAVTAARIPGARPLALGGAGHMVSLERPGEFNKAVRAFLEEKE
jgi:pimeloyl-ACP methyl ester carboxylesterase